MGIRLLPKSEVQRQKAEEHRQAIQEGMKLAKRVDSLREVQAQEEASLAKFRHETLTKIHAEITEATARRDTLKSEVRVLEKRRKDALAPLIEETAALEKARTDLSDEKAALKEKEAEIRNWEQEALVTRENAKLELLGARTERDQTAKALRKATQAKKDAQLALRLTEETRHRTQALEADFFKELKQRDMHTAARERDVTIKEERLAEEEEKLKKEWILLEDRKAMFERTLTRNK